MSAISKIKEKLKNYPELKYQVVGNSISIPPILSTGFTIWLTENISGFTVGFDGWHEEFDHENDALNCIAFGLSDQCRLKIVKYGKIACSWTLEMKNEHGWAEESRTGLIFIPFWKKRSVEYLTNSIIKSN